jgi:hypothetical protein
MSGFEIVLVGPPLALLIMAAGACAWLAVRANQCGVRTSDGRRESAQNGAGTS